jgi:hypothetical protein
MPSLAGFAAAVRATVERTPESLHRTRDSVVGFALVEQVCHLADLEDEGFAIRIRRILTEANPSLADFRGGEIAKERRYIEQPLAPALRRFEETRAANVATLSAASETALQRVGTQEGVGEVTLARVAEMMAAHDASHAGELRDLLAELGVDAPAELLAFV